MAYYPLGSRIAYAMPDIIGKRSADIRKTKRRGFDLVSEEDMLSGAYLDYEISREIRTYLLSSASGIDSLRILIEALVDKVLRIAISNGQEDHSGQKKIAVDARIICRQIPANYSRMQGLGDSRGSHTACWGSVSPRSTGGDRLDEILPHTACVSQSFPTEA